MYLLGTRPQGCNKHSESVALSRFHISGLTTPHSLGTTRTGFLVCGSSLNYLTRHRVLLRNLRRRYSVREIRHRFPLKRISKLLTGYLKIPNHFGYLSHSNTRLSRIPRSQSSMLEFLLIHRIRSMASLSSTLSFPVWHVISWCAHVLQWFIEFSR